MIQFIILGAIALIALVAIIVVIVRHLRQVAALDLESLPAEQEAAMKAALLERRLKRKMSSAKNRFLPMFRRLGQAIAGIFTRFYKRMAQLEQHYRRKPQLMTAAQQQDVRAKTKALMDAAQAALAMADFAEAEKHYIEALSWDPKNPHAYLALAEMYLAKKEFGQAEETFHFFFKLTRAQKAGEEPSSVLAGPVSEQELQQAHFDYALALQVSGEISMAKNEVESALKLDEKNPKFLDKLLELSILLKDRQAARKAFESLKSVNPENQKLATFDEQIRAL